MLSVLEPTEAPIHISFQCFDFTKENKSAAFAHVVIATAGEIHFLQFFAVIDHENNVVICKASTEL